MPRKPHKKPLRSGDTCRVLHGDFAGERVRVLVPQSPYYATVRRLKSGLHSLDTDYLMTVSNLVCTKGLSGSRRNQRR